MLPDVAISFSDFQNASTCKRDFGVIFVNRWHIASLTLNAAWPRARLSCALLTRHRSRLIASASRSGALASHSASRIACENSIARLTPRDLRTSTISYSLGDSSRCRFANAGERSHAYGRNRDVAVAATLSNPKDSVE